MNDTIKMPDPMLQSTEMLAICRRAMEHTKIDYDKLPEGPVPGELCQALVQLIVAEAHKFILAKMTYIEIYRIANAENAVMDPNTIPRRGLQLANFIAELGLIAIAARALLEEKIAEAKAESANCLAGKLDPEHWRAHLDMPAVVLMHRFNEFDKTQAMEQERPAHAYVKETGSA